MWLGSELPEGGWLVGPEGSSIHMAREAIPSSQLNCASTIVNFLKSGTVGEGGVGHGGREAEPLHDCSGSGYDGRVRVDGLDRGADVVKPIGPDGTSTPSPICKGSCRGEAATGGALEVQPGTGASLLNYGLRCCCFFFCPVVRG